MISILGQNIKRLREKKELSQSMLAKISDVSKSSINKIENGFLSNLTSDNILKLATALDVTTDELLKSEEDVEYEFDTLKGALDFVVNDKDLIFIDRPLTEAQREFIRSGIENLLKTAEIIDKDK